MDLRALLREDDAVSSVLGVVLMVAVTIILAAVVGTFVLGIGSDLTDESPSTSWDYSMNVNDPASTNSTVLVVHGGGDAVERSQVEVVIDGTTAYEDGTLGASYAIHNGQEWNDRVTAADRLGLDDGHSGEIQSGDMLQIIWTSESGERAAIIGERRLG